METLALIAFNSESQLLLKMLECRSTLLPFRLLYSACICSVEQEQMVSGPNYCFGGTTGRLGHSGYF